MLRRRCSIFPHSAQFVRFLGLQGQGAGSTLLEWRGGDGHLSLLPLDTQTHWLPWAWAHTTASPSTSCLWALSVEFSTCGFEGLETFLIILLFIKLVVEKLNLLQWLAANLGHYLLGSWSGFLSLSHTWHVSLQNDTRLVGSISGGCPLCLCHQCWVFWTGQCRGFLSRPSTQTPTCGMDQTSSPPGVPSRRRVLSHLAANVSLMSSVDNLTPAFPFLQTWKLTGPEDDTLVWRLQGSVTTATGSLLFWILTQATRVSNEPLTLDSALFGHL